MGQTIVSGEKIKILPSGVKYIIESTICTLQVLWADQQYNKVRTKRGIFDRNTEDKREIEERAYEQAIFNDPLWPKEWYLVSVYMTCYALDSKAGARPQQMKFTLPRNLFTHLGLPSVRVVLSVTFIPGFVMIMD